MSATQAAQATRAANEQFMRDYMQTGALSAVQPGPARAKIVDEFGRKTCPGSPAAENLVRLRAAMDRFTYVPGVHAEVVGVFSERGKDASVIAIARDVDPAKKTKPASKVFRVELGENAGKTCVRKETTL
ncbi:hypothetical protein [Gordonia crocea]|uniref:hypothetical protein n=1 Tax=Gordonia crocea TaxID=589162 RepID=UPI001379CA90|nr:hypothetical protein [Gordonia crocea]